MQMGTHLLNVHIVQNWIEYTILHFSSIFFSSDSTCHGIEATQLIKRIL